MLELDQIHNTDCFAAATQIDDESIDALITDPPYPNRIGLFDETLVDGLAMLYLGCKKAKKYVVFFWNPFDVPPPPPGWHEVARHVWHKPDTKSITHYELIIVWSREPKQKVSRVWSIPILDYRSLRDWKPHPTQKPVKLLRYLIEHYTAEGDTVLDPFVGSGTTAVACQQMKRHFLAIEKSPEYAQIAISRLRKREEVVSPDANEEEDVTSEEMNAEAAPEVPAPRPEAQPVAAPQQPEAQAPAKAAKLASPPKPRKRRTERYAVPVTPDVPPALREE